MIKIEDLNLDNAKQKQVMVKTEHDSIQVTNNGTEYALVLKLQGLSHIKLKSILKSIIPWVQ